MGETSDIYMSNEEKAIKLSRKLWGRIVDKVLEDDKKTESKVVIAARKELFMGLFDDYVNEKIKDVT